jgi:hypothetical protein
VELLLPVWCPKKVVLYYWAFIGDTLKIHEEKQKDLSYFLKK